MLIEVIKLKRKAAFKYLPELAPTTSGFKVADCPQYKLVFYRVLCFFIVIFFFFQFRGFDGYRVLHDKLS